MSSFEETQTSETELKFEIAAESLAKLRKHPALAAPRPAERLHSVYFDTPDQDLRHAGLSLRVCERAGAFIQTVKARTGAGLIDRGEWERPVSAKRPDARSLADTPAADVLGSADVGELEPVFETTVDRAIQMWDGDGAQVEVSLDRGEIRAASSREPIRELELELKSGEPAALFVLAHELAKAAPIRLSFDSKAERGYRLAGPDAAASLKAEQAALVPDAPAAAAFRLAARSCLTQIVGNAQLLRRVRGSQALHQTRVGLRRMRAVLTAFRPLIEDARFAWVNAEAKWLAGELDQARDLDVFIQESLHQDDDGLQQDAALAAFTRRLLSAQAAAYERAIAAIDSQRFADFVLEAAAWMEIGAWTRMEDAGAVRLRGTPIGVFGAEGLTRLHRKVKKRGRRLKTLEPEARHHLRIAGKKLRYAAELFTETFPEHPKRRGAYLEALKDMQDRLGELNDLTVASRLALEVAGRRAGGAAFAAGLLIGRRSRNEPEILAQAGEAFDRFADARPFWTHADNA